MEKSILNSLFFNSNSPTLQHLWRLYSHDQFQFNPHKYSTPSPPSLPIFYKIPLISLPFILFSSFNLYTRLTLSGLAIYSYFILSCQKSLKYSLIKLILASQSLDILLYKTIKRIQKIKLLHRQSFIRDVTPLPLILQKSCFDILFNCIKHFSTDVPPFLNFENISNIDLVDALDFLKKSRIRYIDYACSNIEFADSSILRILKTTNISIQSLKNAWDQEFKPRLHQTISQNLTQSPKFSIKKPASVVITEQLESLDDFLDETSVQIYLISKNFTHSTVNVPNEMNKEITDFIQTFKASCFNHIKNIEKKLQNPAINLPEASPCRKNILNSHTPPISECENTQDSNFENNLDLDASCYEIEYSDTSEISCPNPIVQKQNKSTFHAHLNLVNELKTSIIKRKL